MSKGKERIPFHRQREIYKSEIYPIAANLRKKIIDENKVIKNSFKLLEQLGIFLLIFPSEGEISGFHIKKSNINCIYINSKMVLGRQYFSCWHEYYHAIMEKSNGISCFGQASKDEEECKADLFAGYVLMPENLVESYLINNNININEMTKEDVVKIQIQFRVSYLAVIKRLQIIYGEIKGAEELKKLSNKERPNELIEFIDAMGCSTELSKKTETIYIPKVFLENIEANYQNKRINESKKKFIEKLIKDVEDES